jgi:hypothetical protein
LLGLSRRTLQRKLQEMGRVKRIRRRNGPSDPAGGGTAVAADDDDETADE